MRNGSAWNLTEALEALTVEELRAFVVDALERLDDGPRADLEDMLLKRAAQGSSGWKPAPPSAAFVEEARAFATAARRVGQADPAEVDDYLRQAITASLAGDHAAARAVFEALLEPIGDGDIFLGQDEMVDELLSVDLHECVCRHVTSVYATTPAGERAEAVLKAIEAAGGLSYLRDPIEEITTALGGPPPDLVAFLPAWIERLERDAKPSSDWESDRERWLRAAVGRRDGVKGLERIARSTKRPEAARAWCDALVVAGDWSKALAAYETSAALVERDHLRGDFLDGAARAALALGRKDVLKKFESAWLGAPSLLRLLRWLLEGEASSSTIRKRAAAALAQSPTKAPRIIGVLQVLAGDIPSAALHLAKCTGLGWSQADHAGHVLFPAFAWLLGGAPSGSVREGVVLALQRPLQSDLEYEAEPSTETSVAAAPRLSNPTLLEVLQHAGAMARLSRSDRTAMLQAMKAAAVSRTDGVLGNKRRRHYGHAAQLVACCVEIEDGSGTARDTSQWAEALRERTSRFPAFQGELRAALAQARRGTAMP